VTFHPQDEAKIKRAVNRDSNIDAPASHDLITVRSEITRKLTALSMKKSDYFRRFIGEAAQSRPECHEKSCVFDEAMDGSQTEHWL
jgi:hypothetical protein